MTERLNYYVDLRGDLLPPKLVDGIPVEPLGKELASILAANLPRHGVEVVDIDESEEAAYIKCRAGGPIVELMVGFEVGDSENGRWNIMVCGKRSLFGRKAHSDTDVRPLLFAIDEILDKCDRVTDVRWFPNFDTPEYLALLRPSGGPIRDPDLDKEVARAIRFDRFTNMCHKVFFPWLFLAGGIGLGLAKKDVPNHLRFLGLVYVAAIVVVAFVLPFIAGQMIRSAAQRTKR